jgi:hypothetical protein
MNIFKAILLTNSVIGTTSKFCDLDLVNHGHHVELFYLLCLIYSAEADDDADNDIGVDSVYAELSNSDAVVVDRSVSINSITSNEFRAMKFESVNEAYDFYYRYGKYKGFAIRKSEVRRRGSKGSEIIVMR